MTSRSPDRPERKQPEDPCGARRVRPPACLALVGLGLLALLGSARAVEVPPPRAPGAGPPAGARPQPGPVRAALRFTIEPYLQDVRPDGIVVAWATDVPSTGVVRVDRASVRASFVAEAAATHHRVRVTGLAAGQRYGYVVAVRRAGDVGAAAGSELVSAPAEFVTAPLTDSPFLFLVYGDNRDRDADHLAVIRAMQPEQPDLIVQTGDMVSRAGDEAQWRRYFAAAAPLLRSVPMFPALGNHELRGDPDASRFFRFFGLPTVVPPLGQAAPGPGQGLAQGLAAPGAAAEPPVRRRRPVYYAFRYSNSLFIALDGNSPYDGDQAAWLERTLGEAQHDRTVRHLFVFVHQPPYAVGAYCGSERLQRRIVPLLQRAARGPRPLLRAVFAGHEHAYQHLERGGVRYFITGGGGAPLYPRSQSCDREDDLALRLFRAEHHYLRVQVDGQAATLLALSRSGEVMERVLLHEPVVLDEEPVALLPTETPTLRPGQPGGVAARERTSGPILLLWVSAIATLSGLLLLTRPSRRRDLSPSSRRHRDDDEA